MLGRHSQSTSATLKWQGASCQDAQSTTVHVACIGRREDSARAPAVVSTGTWAVRLQESRGGVKARRHTGTLKVQSLLLGLSGGRRFVCMSLTVFCEMLMEWFSARAEHQNPPGSLKKTSNYFKQES